MSVIEVRLAGLVHASAQDDPAERARHERFIISRMTTGAIALACLPVYLGWRGVPSLQEFAAIVCLVLPLVAAVILARTGRLAVAHAVSSLALTGFIACIAASSGGLSSAALIWLVAVPIEAMLSGSRGAAVGASLIAAGGALLVALLDAAGLLPPSAPWPAGIAMPVFAMTALAHAASQSILHARSEADRQAAALAREAHDRSLLQAIDDLVTWHDRNGHVLKASPASLKLVEVPAPALLGRGLFSRVHVADRPTFLKALSDAATGDRAVVAQFRLQVGLHQPAAQAAPFRAPEVVWVEMRAHRVEAAQAGEGFAVVAVTRDISEHKRRAEELEAARAEAERADLSKGCFLATVSHELRTPLNAIIGFSEILSSEGLAIDGSRRREYAEIIRDSGTHLLDVVNTLLDMSKIETGNFDFVPEPFDLGLLAQGCCDLIGLKAEQAGLLLEREIGDDLGEVIADRRACRQILINLLSNAVKFTPRSGRVTVTARRAEGRVLLTVSDTGVGIAEKDLARLGEPFFQARAAYDRPHEGTGLGLSVVRGLVGLHHGTLTVESAPGQGTTVTVSLPADCRAAAGGAIKVVALPRPTVPARLSVPARLIA